MNTLKGFSRCSYRAFIWGAEVRWLSVGLGYSMLFKGFVSALHIHWLRGLRFSIRSIQALQLAQSQDPYF